MQAMSQVDSQQGPADKAEEGRLMGDSGRALEKIKRNIEAFGLHVYVVRSAQVPRFAYSIGLTETLGHELVFAGGAYFSFKEAGTIIAALHKELIHGNGSTGCFSIDGLGSFSLGPIHANWVEKMLLGAVDYYGHTRIRALQIVPEGAFRTIDIPKLDTDYSPSESPGWRWLFEPWSFDVPSDSTVTTNLDALQGECITEVMRWEETDWEMFAGPGPDVEKTDIRIVPIGCIIESDPSLVSALELSPGSGQWREDSAGEWHPWRTAQA